MSLRLFGTDIHPCPVLQLLNTILDARIALWDFGFGINFGSRCFHRSIYYLSCGLCYVYKAYQIAPQHLSSPDVDFVPY